MTILDLIRESCRLTADAICAELAAEPDAERLKWRVRGAAERAHGAFVAAMSESTKAVLEAWEL